MTKYITLILLLLTFSNVFGQTKPTTRPVTRMLTGPKTRPATKPATQPITYGGKYISHEDADKLYQKYSSKYFAIMWLMHSNTSTFNYYNSEAVSFYSSPLITNHVYSFHDRYKGSKRSNLIAHERLELIDKEKDGLRLRVTYERREDYWIPPATQPKVEKLSEKEVFIQMDTKYCSTVGSLQSNVSGYVFVGYKEVLTESGGTKDIPIFCPLGRMDRHDFINYIKKGNLIIKSYRVATLKEINEENKDLKTEKDLKGKNIHFMPVYIEPNQSGYNGGSVIDKN